MLRKDHFGKVVAMADRGADRKAMGRFAAAAYASTWDCRNIYLGRQFPGIQYLAVQAALRRKKRIAMLVHNTASLRRRLPLATLGLGRLVHRYLCLSERSKQELEASYHVDASRITVIGSRVDTKFFTPDPDARIELQVCSAGAVNRDYATLIDAVAPLGIPLKIAADTAWRYSTREVTSQEVPPFVEMRSWGTYEKLRELYATSAVVVVPLEKPMLSGVTVVLEAMAMGDPSSSRTTCTSRTSCATARTRCSCRRATPRRCGKKFATCSTIRTMQREWDNGRANGAHGFSVAAYVSRILSVWE